MGIMQPDKNAGRSGEYVVRSLYFDDYSDSCLYDNINGTDPREKFRIRIYNTDLSYIRLERKCKENGKTMKASCRIDERLCMEMIQGRSRCGCRCLQEILPVAEYKIFKTRSHYRI